MGKMNMYKNIFLVLFVIACMSGFLLSSRHALTEENQQTGREKIMSETTNPNIGKNFPEVTADSLAKTPVSIPGSAKGKVVLIAVAFLRESQPQLDSWLGPFTERFASKEGFTFYEIPMISSGYRFMRFIIDSGMRGGIPKEKHKNVVTMYGDVEKYMNELKLDARYGYAFLLDREGIIRWQSKGFSTPEALKELFEMAEKLAL
jgi:hypothetical protein